MDLSVAYFTARDSGRPTIADRWLPAPTSTSAWSGTATVARAGPAAAPADGRLQPENLIKPTFSRSIPSVRLVTSSSDSW